MGRTTIAFVLMATMASAQVPPAATRMAAGAGVTDPVMDACPGEFRAGRRGFAIAAGTRYLVLDGTGTPVQLATFDGKPDLSCYSRTQARELHRDIQRSETLSGRVVPRFDTTTICAFVNATTARCWQYSPMLRMYVEVGGWST